jgi:hypothetical protein
MSEQSDYNSKDLRLHRKYILVLCFILIFLKFGGVTMKDVTLMGTTFEISNSIAIFLGLWSILFYSIFRYYQYFRHESWGHVRSEFRSLQTRYYQRKLLQILSKHIYPRLLAVKYPETNAQISAPGYFNGSKSGLFTRRLQLSISTIDNVPKQNQEHTIYNQPVDIKYNLIGNFSLQTLRVIGQFVFNTPFFFEFLFPFLLVIATLFYCGIAHWDGSFQNILK